MENVYGYRIKKSGKIEVTAEEFDALEQEYPDASVWCEHGIWYIKTY